MIMPTMSSDHADFMVESAQNTLCSSPGEEEGLFQGGGGGGGVISNAIF